VTVTEFIVLKYCQPVMACDCEIFQEPGREGTRRGKGDAALLSRLVVEVGGERWIWVWWRASGLTIMLGIIQRLSVLVSMQPCWDGTRFPVGRWVCGNKARHTGGCVFRVFRGIFSNASSPQSRGRRKPPANAANHPECSSNRETDAIHRSRQVCSRPKKPPNDTQRSNDSRRFLRTLLLRKSTIINRQSSIHYSTMGCLADWRWYTKSNADCDVFGSMQACGDGTRFLVGRRSGCDDSTW